MSLFHTLERIVWLANKKRTTKILVDHLDFNVLSKPRTENFSLLIQGPITTLNNDYFVKLVDSYKNMVGSERIRVACSAITESTCEYLLKNKIKWVRCNVDESGPGNILYQAGSVVSGLEICENESVVKVRNDQFIQRWDFIDAHEKHISTGKIFVCGYTLLNPIFHVGDMVHYGTKDILEAIWRPISNLVNIKTLLQKFNYEKIVQDGGIDLAAQRKIPPEVVVGLSIASLHGCSELSLNAYKAMLCSRLICANNTDIGLQWAKHNAVLDFHRAWTKGYRETIDYQKWLALSALP